MIAVRGTPSPVSMSSSADESASTVRTVLPTSRSIRLRTTACSAVWLAGTAWSTDMTDLRGVPSVWKVCTTGTRVPRVAPSAARPLVQKWACTTSGGRCAQRWASSLLNAPSCGSSRSCDRAAAGPAGRYSNRTPPASSAPGRAGESLRA